MTTLPVYGVRPTKEIWIQLIDVVYYVVTFRTSVAVLQTLADALVAEATQV